MEVGFLEELMSTSVEIIDLFYQRIIKAPLTLQERKKIGDCLIEAAKITQKDKWEEISLHKHKYEAVIKKSQ